MMIVPLLRYKVKGSDKILDGIDSAVAMGPGLVIAQFLGLGKKIGYQKCDRLGSCNRNLTRLKLLNSSNI